MRSAALRPTVLRAVSVVILLAVIGCRGDAPYVVPEGPMPPNTILLSQMMRELSATPGFTDALLAQLNRNGKEGPTRLTPSLMKRLRELILGKNWQDLDRFPGWTMNAVNPTVRIAGKIVSKDDKTQAAVVSSGAPSGKVGGTLATADEHIDLGPYALDKAGTVSLDEPSKLPGFTTEGIVTEMGAGVTRGDGPNPTLAPLHAESQRLADVLNRLSVNDLEGAEPFRVKRLEGYPPRDSSAGPVVYKLIEFYSSPETLVRALQATGHTVNVYDARYFANFGHFHFKGQDVMMPFFLNSQIGIPDTKRSLLVPVSHAEYEWEIRGPKINANVSFYFGIDGKAEFRTMDTLDQAWVLGHHAHTYTGADAVEVTRLVGRMVLAYTRQHIRRPDLPFGGYYTLGVCQDGVAAIEKKMTGKATLFPNTADSDLFDDPRDAEINTLIHAIPKDRSGAPPEPERIFGSIPTDNYNAITIPGLAADLTSVHDAWQNGELTRTRSVLQKMWLTLIGAGMLIGFAALVFRHRRRTRHSS
jgi:hypothetical protein